jgi:hypothetical protein
VPDYTGSPEDIIFTPLWDPQTFSHKYEVLRVPVKQSKAKWRIRDLDMFEKWRWWVWFEFLRQCLWRIHWHLGGTRHLHFGAEEEAMQDNGMGKHCLLISSFTYSSALKWRWHVLPKYQLITQSHIPADRTLEDVQMKIKISDVCLCCLYIIFSYFEHHFHSL